MNIIVNQLEQPGCNKSRQCNHKRANTFYKMVACSEYHEKYLIPSVSGKVVACRRKQCDSRVWDLNDSNHFPISLTDIVSETRLHGTYYVNYEPIETS